MKQNLILVAAAILAIGVGLTAKQLTTPVETTTASPLSIQLPDHSGTLRDINEWDGKVRVINFWATWCPPCLEEIPVFIQLQSEYRQRDVQFIGIAIEERGPVVDFIHQQQINYPVLIGGDTAITLSRQMGNFVDAVPFTIIVNRQGQIVYRHPGELSREKLTAWFDKLL